MEINLSKQEVARLQFLEIVNEIAPQAEQSVEGILFELHKEGGHTIHLTLRYTEEGGELLLDAFQRGSRIARTYITLGRDGYKVAAKALLLTLEVYLGRVNNG